MRHHRREPHLQAPHVPPAAPQAPAPSPSTALPRTGHPPPATVNGSSPRSIANVTAGNGTTPNSAAPRARNPAIATPGSRECRDGVAISHGGGCCTLPA
ncbi:hypothetical protein ACFQ2M_33465 [Kitasatospora saccharophila]|uniref:hypothetical protein n=1 Tax=Kitasatospora saccharophila TaxID=407973 RepID=UPI00363571BF